MRAPSLLLESLNTRSEKYRTELKNCRNEFSEEAVHDVRVAARRLLSSLDLLRSVLRESNIQKLRRSLKDQLDELDDLRDTQVLIAEISESIHDKPELGVFRTFLQKEEKQLLRGARKKIKSVKVKNFTKQVQKIHEAATGLSEPELDARLLSAVDEAFTTVNERYTLMDSSQPATIHRLRIAFKKFRYMVEVIYPLIAGFPEDKLKAMHEYQSLMGEIQDSEVALQKISDIGETEPLIELESARLFYEKSLIDTVSRYIEDKGQVLTFWRSAPEQSFPWEK